jgi:hypothetical protein
MIQTLSQLGREGELLQFDVNHLEKPIAIIMLNDGRLDDG